MLKAHIKQEPRVDADTQEFVPGAMLSCIILNRHDVANLLVERILEVDVGKLLGLEGERRISLLLGGLDDRETLNGLGPHAEKVG